MYTSLFGCILSVHFISLVHFLGVKWLNNLVGLCLLLFSEGVLQFYNLNESFEVSVYILNTSSLSIIWFADYFLPVFHLLYLSLSSDFQRAAVFNFDEIKFFSLHFYGSCSSFHRLNFFSFFLTESHQVFPDNFF